MFVKVEGNKNGKQTCMFWGKQNDNIPRSQTQCYNTTDAKACSFVSSVHCMTHHTKLVVKTLSGFTLLVKIKTLFVGMYNFFTHNLTRLLKHPSQLKFWNEKETRSKKIL